MNEQERQLEERQLMDGLRALAAMEPQQASPRVEQTLRAVFRARAERRRRAAWTSAAAALAAIAAAVVLLYFAGIPRARHWEAPQIANELASTPGVQNAVVRTDELSFYPLPEADELPPVETSLVLRVQMPASSLELMGFPVSDAADTGPVQAELLVGQDGLARGVRVIQQ